MNDERKNIIQLALDPVNRPITLTVVAAGVWLCCWFDWLKSHVLSGIHEWFGYVAYSLVFALGVGIAATWLKRLWREVPHVRLFAAAMLAMTVWQAGVYFTDLFEWFVLRVWAARLGLAAFFGVGLACLIAFIEFKSSGYRRARMAAEFERRGGRPAVAVAGLSQPSVGVPAQGSTTVGGAAPDASGGRITNPLDEEAYYYGKKAKKFNQSVAAIVVYTLVFVIGFWIMSLTGCQEIYEMPAGGGEQAQLPQVVQVKKVKRQKFVINPLSVVDFNPPPVEETVLELLKITKHAYTVGYGKGKGAGFAGGTRRGMVRFIRLEYPGGDWNQDMGSNGIGPDLNMLVQYGVRTQHKVAKLPETRTISQLGNFKKYKSPPFVYMTGERNISLSKGQIETLRDYMLDKHGMIFADNGGSGQWHGQFVAMMRRILPKVEPVQVPLDDPIHLFPYPIGKIPYVAPHGGTRALGWKVDGRWVAYYHPGDIGDAWADGHAGVRREVWESCYRLGTNVIYYSHHEYNKWLDAQNQDEDD